MAHKVTSANEPNPLTGKRLSSCPLTRSGVTEVAQTAGRTPKMEEFVPWTVDNLKSQFEAVGLLMAHSYLPANAEEGIAYPPLVHTYESLSPASTCRVCDLLDTLVNHSDAPVAFFEDYALLCYYCLNAPRAWISSLITGMDFLHILIKYFPMAGGLDSLFMPSRILAIDIQLHFYICRCFLPVSSSDMIRNANLGYYKLEFLKSILTGQSPANFCFKSMWPRTTPTFLTLPGPRTCKDSQDVPGDIGRGQYTALCCHLPTRNRVQHPFLRAEKGGLSPEITTKADYCGLLLGTWQGTDLLGGPGHHAIGLNVEYSGDELAELALAITRPEAGDHSQGPCLLAPMFGLRHKNASRTICPLCESLGAHPDAKDTLDRFKSLILDSFGNNIKILDRIVFLIKTQNTLLDVPCPRLRAWLQMCTPQDFHKHLFCDPLCAINHSITNPSVLFGQIYPPSFQAFKAALAAGQNLEQGVCDSLITLVYIFKSTQVARVGKTILVDVTKELDVVLRIHGLDLVQSYQTSQVYV